METSSKSSKPTTLIVGAGIFGTSTAYHLSRSEPNPSNVTILDRASFPPPPASDRQKHPLGASADINKIVRADYSVPFYMALAYEAMDAWSSLPLIKSFYHGTGWVMLDEMGSDLAQRIRKNFKESGREDPTKDMTFEEVRESWGGLLREADLDGYGSAYWNPGAGWAEADRAVVAMLEEAVDKGVKYIQGEVVELILHVDDGRGVKGVKLADGRVVEADKLVLATGPWTSLTLSSTEDKLKMEKSARIEQQVKAAGVCVAHYALSSKEKEKFDRIPVVVYGSNGEILPPPPSRLLKFTNANSFTNTITTSSGHRISAPPNTSQGDVPQTLKSETLDIISHIMPSMTSNDRPVAWWRLCWDSITPSQHQLITKHPDPRLGNLYLAVGGSFHSWKFLPIIGKYVVNVLNGVSNGEEKDQNWAWKSEGWNDGQRGAHEKVIPRRELKDLEDTNGKSKL